MQNHAEKKVLQEQGSTMGRPKTVHHVGKSLQPFKIDNDRDLDGKWTLRYHHSSVKNKVAEVLLPIFSWFSTVFNFLLLNLTNFLNSLEFSSFYSLWIIFFCEHNFFSLDCQSFAWHKFFIVENFFFVFCQVKRLWSTIPVYVNENALENAKVRAVRTKCLVRNLVEIVFTAKALSVCTRSGKNGSRQSRTMLNQEALEAIYNYADDYQKKKTFWKNIDRKDMSSAVTKKIDDQRREEKENTKRAMMKKRFS